jgi:hypothetical protein
MGGLLLRSALGLRKPNPFEGIGRIVFIAPPFRGSCDIPKVLIAGEKNGWLSDQEDFRKLARSFPSVYQLIPAFPKAAVDESGNELDLFDFKNWQANVAQKGKLNETFLANAEAFRRGTQATQGGASDAPMLPDDELRQHADDTLVLMSVGYPTVYQIPVLTQNPPNRNWFDFEHALSDLRGDERVHLRSAAIEGIPLAAYRGADSHGTVCRDYLIIRSAATWLKGQRLFKMKPRTAKDSVARRAKSYFEPWDGQKDSLDGHIVDL